ncbi:MAG: hypothetical protein ACTSUF_09600, partial [Candidatus Heimdallarchaeaceae archaeon]
MAVENTFEPKIILHPQSFWGKKLAIIVKRSLPHQWAELERSGTINNFRIVARIKEGFREGFYYTDSDAYKWGEATSLSLIYNYNEFLKRKLDEFVGIISK